MRAALCMFVILFAGTSLGYAGDDDKDKWGKPVRVPTFELNGGYTARFGADESRIWQTPDPTAQSDGRQDLNRPVFGLTISRPLKF